MSGMRDTNAAAGGRGAGGQDGGQGSQQGSSGGEPGHPLIEAFLDGELSAEQGQALMVWLEADGAHLRRFVRETHAHHALHDIFSARAAADEIVVETDGETLVNRARPAAARARRVSPRLKRMTRREGWRRWQVAAMAVALAATVLIAVGLWQGRYPAPEAQGAIEVAAGRKLERGATVKATGGGAALRLGGYCDIQMASGSALRIDGAAKAEEVFLTQGRVDCAVDRNVGSFQVRTEVGSVSVTGTRFTVELVPQQGAVGMNRKAMAFALAVAVTVGSVKVDYNGQETVLRVGESRIFGADMAPLPGGDPNGNGLPPPPAPPRGGMRPLPPDRVQPGANNAGGANVPPPLPQPVFQAQPGVVTGTDGNVPQPPDGNPGTTGGPGSGEMPPPGAQPGPKGPPPPLLVALDTNRDGELSAAEIANAATALKKLDHNKDGKIDKHELHPMPPPPPAQGGQPGTDGASGPNVQPGKPGQPGGTNGQGGAGVPGNNVRGQDPAQDRNVPPPPGANPGIAPGRGVPPPAPPLGGGGMGVQ